MLRCAPMDPGVILSCAFAFLICFGPLVGIYLFNARRNRRWAALARDLGMQGGEPANPIFSVFGAAPAPIRGERAGVEIVLSYAPRQEGGSGAFRRARTCVECTLPRPLGLGLWVNPFGALDRFGRNAAYATHKALVKTGDPELDDSHLVCGTEARFVQLLLSAPRVREAIAWSRRAGFPAQITDEKVTLSRVGAHLDLEQIEPILDIGVELARRLVAAREAIGDASVGQRVR